MPSNPIHIATWHPLTGSVAPEWASAWGQDAHGPFAEFEFGDAVQRLRWIPEGVFQMGSPDGEPGRIDDQESPQHQVRISRGFWLFDTPCPQKLWEAVMGDNPSHFKSLDRPVEQVSWLDCEEFLQQFNENGKGLQLSLPTEAEWEYACRAGTTDATYAGPIEFLGVNHAPVLDSIGWYGGNCGLEFDLDNGVSASGWSEKQYAFDNGGTRIVATKDPNTWGLYDMLGNVREWCRDGQREYEQRNEGDPVGSESASAYRVVRGGSWDRGARDVRAAYRHSNPPGLRNSSVGFRCRVQ